jgi:hypothetical protein
MGEERVLRDARGRTYPAARLISAHQIGSHARIAGWGPRFQNRCLVGDPRSDTDGLVTWYAIRYVPVLQRLGPRATRAVFAAGSDPNGPAGRPSPERRTAPKQFRVASVKRRPRRTVIGRAGEDLATLMNCQRTPPRLAQSVGDLGQAASNQLARTCAPCSEPRLFGSGLPRL